MMRPLYNCFVGILQLFRNNVKPLILVASFGTFIWLVVSTTRRPEFTRHANRHHQQRLQELELENRWSESSVQIFLSLLEVDTNVTRLASRARLESCPLNNELVFSAFVDVQLEETLWSYYTLIAFRQKGATFRDQSKGRIPVEPFLPLSSKEKLERLFERVPMDAMSELSFDCYDIASAIVLNGTTDIPLPQGRSQIYILDNGARRYQDLVTVDWIKERPTLRLAQAAPAMSRLAKLRSLEPAGLLQSEFVGIYIRRDDLLPFDYYYRAIAFQRKLHGARLIFVVVCEEPLGKLCTKLHAPVEEVYVQGSRPQDPGFDFALMSLCNHTIVSNQEGIFHALNNGGDVVVYEFDEPEARVRYVPWRMANELDRWYMLG